MRRLAFFALGCAVGAIGLWGWTTFGGHLSGNAPYAGQQTRSVSSLSAEDIAQLERGAGWGLAKPAELNGYPGPLHILELSDKLDLTTEQRTRIESAFNAMNAKARQLGSALIEAEAALDAAFEAGSINEAQLAERLATTERTRAALRQVHLAAHIEVTPLLTDEQKTRYAELRGYGAGGHGGHGGH
ncbi:MAG: Spy/CpxP family protein refolding chaperone [Pseudomonadota bacterium]